MPQTRITAYGPNETLEPNVQRFHSKLECGTETTGVSFQGLRPPESGGLRPSMVNDKLKLQINDIIMAKGTTDDDIQIQVRRHLVCSTIGACFPGLFDKIFGAEDPSQVCPMPQVEIQEIPEVQVDDLHGLPFDAYTEEGTEHVIEEIFLSQYGLPESDFYDKVFMLFTDQKTLENIRIMKFLHDEEEDYGHASKKWLLPFPSMFNTRMHALEMMLRGHFGGDPSKGGSLYNHLQFLGIPNVSEAQSEFYSLEELVMQSYRARILSFLEEKFDMRPDQLQEHFRQWQPQQMTDLIEEITQNITNVSNWNSFDPQFHNDQEVQAHYLFLRHSEVYFVLKHAIDCGDIGLLKRAISMCCLQFHGSGQANYAYQILHMIRYVIAPTIPQDIQQVLLINSIIQARIFEKLCGKQHPTSVQDQINNVWKLATKMYENRSSRVTPGRLVIYPAKNLAHEGRLNLSRDRLKRFNLKEVDKFPDDDYPEQDTLQGHFDVYVDRYLQ